MSFKLIFLFFLSEENIRRDKGSVADYNSRGFRTWHRRDSNPAQQDEDLPQREHLPLPTRAEYGSVCGYYTVGKFGRLVWFYFLFLYIIIFNLFIITTLWKDSLYQKEAIFLLLFLHHRKISLYLTVLTPISSLTFCRSVLMKKKCMFSCAWLNVPTLYLCVTWNVCFWFTS